MNNTKTADDFISEFLVVHDTVGLQRTEIRNMLHAYGRFIGELTKYQCKVWSNGLHSIEEEVNIEELLK